MTRTIEIGQGPRGPVLMDVDLMLRQGLYVQANSGGGKSWLLRRLAEQLCAHVPTFVVDVEGEFASLRERFPFFLVARDGGDAAATPHTAGIIARKLLELRVSAVFDIFGLDMAERHAWMKGFLEGLDQAPRDVWGDTAILIDEAHVFAPEKGKGESVALAGMAALATRGRKRGFGPCDATQRGAKFNKDVQSELKNAAVGLNTWEIDRERAREALGVGRSERDAYDKQLRAMDAGEFFLVGRAFGTFDPVKVKVGPVQSTHPEPGQAKQVIAPPPPAKIRAMLARLGDIPKEAEREATTEKDLREEVARLRRELAGANAGDMAGSREVDRLRTRVDDLTAENETLRGQLRALPTPNEAARLRDMETFFERVIGAVDGYREASGGVYARASHSPEAEPAAPRGEWGKQGTIGGRPVQPPRPFVPMSIGYESAPASDAGDGAARMLRALAARHPTPLTEQQVAVLAGMSRKGGTYRTYRGKLTGQGLVTKDGQFLRITPAGLKAAGAVPRPTSPADLLAVWRDRFGGKARDLLELLASCGRVMTKPEALGAVGLDPAGGTARTYWGQLAGCGLIERAPGGFRIVESLRL